MLYETYSIDIVIDIITSLLKSLYHCVQLDKFIAILLSEIINLFVRFAFHYYYDEATNERFTKKDWIIELDKKNELL